MSYGIQNLRRSAVYDQLTPGAPRYSEEQNASNDYYEAADPRQPDDNRGILGPDGRPLDDRGEEPTSSGLAKLADLHVDPNKGDEKERLKGYLDTIQGAYTPNYSSRNRNENLLDNFPTRGQPTKMDRFTAMMVGLGSKNPIEDQEKILQSGYHRDRADWVTKSEPFYKAAQLENTDNTNTRQVLGTAANTFTQGERINQQEKAANQRYEVGLITANARRAAAEGYNNMIQTADGFYAVNNNGDKKYLGKAIKLSDAERISLEGEIKRDVAHIGADSRVAAAGVRANSSSTGVSNQWYVDENGLNFKFKDGQAVDINGNPVRPGNDIEKVRTDREAVDTASNTATDLKNRQRVMYDTNKHNAQKYLIRNSDGTFSPRKRPEAGTWPFGNSDVSTEQREYDAMMTELYPGVYTSPTSAPTGAPQDNSGSNLPGGPIKPGGPGDGTLRSRAADELKKRGLPVTQKNIDWAIQTKKVR